MTEIDGANAVVPQTFKVQQSSRKDIVFINGIAKWVDCITGNHGVADLHSFDCMGVSDGRGDTASQIGLAQSVRSGYPIDLVFDDSAAFYGQIAV